MRGQLTASAPHPSVAVKALLPLLAWLTLLGMTARDLSQHIWKTPENSYAPWLLLTSLALLAFHAVKFNWHQQNPPHSSKSFALLVLSLGAPGFALGHALQLELVTAMSSLMLLTGSIAWSGGFAALRVLRFPLFFSLLALPYPAYWVNSLTNPIKVLISQATEFIFYHLGFPVAREGVILALGPYRLLVADACSGLNSLVFLVALGLLYIHFTAYRPRWHRLLLALLLPLLAIMANGIRVIALALITYYFGDAAGQSFLHNAAGIVLFMSGFFGLLLADSLLKKIHVSNLVPKLPLASAKSAGWPRVSLLSSVALTGFLIATGISSQIIKPTQYLAQINPMPPLALHVPEHMGQWIADKRNQLLLVAPDEESFLRVLYSQTLARVYTNPQGQQIMLAIAYGGHQFGNELQAHRPESCYKSKGFEMLQSNDVNLSIDGTSLRVRQLVGLRRDRIEPVSYWMTVGDTPTLPGLSRKWVQFQQGLQGQIPDGFLVRVSSLDNDFERAFKTHADFIGAMHIAGLSRLGLPKRKAPL